MDIQDYKFFDGDILKNKIQSLSRGELDDQIQQFGGQYAVLCQRLESLYTPDRIERFMLIRPGGVSEIDKETVLAEKDLPKAVPLLKSFRELNRILQPFMDVYEARVLSDLEYMSKEELTILQTNVIAQITAAETMQKAHPEDYRKTQNANGTLRLAALMKKRIEEELKKRFGFEVI